ncbi:tRNA (adenosine(37)-N6)-threonylcarbamoyltransferase complex ATPase subunit type 1 TsaE [Legionella micdadei]|uniref:tRNA threonylcarbamoyladenosine biosynthesis protein TsaE n=1 Tax=Legionella micdadei TaxID=451 RepID=A0A098GJA5_LEGMI|nr:tRNA (adenosine(37)-N6)-threonylcarbamoyltransferase complex ATPase subunit type 1 TsaE [Legionella micdadei]ARG96582.1 tRNA (adenosine(37)-N6)-threonylcarbamoyltransferase complex ATPase subunit type 1 TsaE [Legionella micdadei]ARG99331.1 tRNA (adenosine(37)-N6)-threonylcarbamoyltransferase complex ATPase subunit type 1 TsaE [Legionella micdadei]KTD27345.1 ATPase with strong ADP affinity [Legionella micdadei]NSL18865.1 tRNA (adenosine(37)-N6)-threonylcarbamoyltransferase complex ATPase subu
MTTVSAIDLPDETSSEMVATHLAACLTPPLILTFSGEIGAGKTTFIRAMLRVLGVKTAIKSPTFSLVESYQCEHLQIHHFDLYRIHDETELEYIGFRDYFLANSICCIEWPERASHTLEHVDMNFAFEISGSGRLLTVRALSAAGETMLSCLVGKQ